MPQTSVDTTRTKPNKPIRQTGTNPTRHRTRLSTRASNSPRPQCLVQARSIKAAACGGLRRASSSDVILCVFPQQRLNETKEKEARELRLSHSPSLWWQRCCCCFPKTHSSSIIIFWSAVMTAAFKPMVCLGFLRKPSGLD